MAGLVEQGLGISLVPELTLFQFRQMDLVAIPLEAGEPMRPILIVKRRDQALSLAAQAMLALIEKPSASQFATPPGTGMKQRRAPHVRALPARSGDCLSELSGVRAIQSACT